MFHRDICDHTESERERKIPKHYPSYNKGTHRFNLVHSQESIDNSFLDPEDELPKKSFKAKLQEKMVFVYSFSEPRACDTEFPQGQVILI